MSGPPAHLLSAAAAWERILTKMHPDQTWVVTVRDDWDKPREPAPDRAEPPEGAAGIDTHRLCEGKTAKGRACRAQALPGSHFCAGHDPERPTSARWGEVRRLHDSGELDRYRRSLEDEKP